jgi:2-polyprenyl-3-methyl-5-hydroxy-6-metoxy-1,4-benzoquinol methylase
MTTLTSCPLCGHQNLKPVLTCVDHTVSHETFTLTKCSNCNFLMTNPRPDDGVIGAYYKSEDYISHTNKAASLIDSIYLRARRYTLRWKLQILNNTNPKEKTLLDYGCGTGAFIHFLQQNNWNVNGIEPSDDARLIASNLTGREISSSIPQLTASTFNVITLWHVLEHVPNLDETIQQLRAKLDDNGTMFIAVPNHSSWEAKKYQSHWAGYDVPRHLWHFSQTTMNSLMTKNNLKIVNTIPMKLDAFYISLLSEKYKRQSSSLLGMIKAFLSGLRSNQDAKTNNEYSSLIYVIKK